MKEDAMQLTLTPQGQEVLLGVVTSAISDVGTEGWSHRQPGHAARLAKAKESPVGDSRPAQRHGLRASHLWMRG